MRRRSIDAAFALLLILSFFVFTLPASADVVRSITFPVEASYTFRDDFLDPRDGGARQHRGNDILADKMTKLLAAVDGIVVYMAIPQAPWGYSIDIQDADGFQYQYYHINNDMPGTDDGKGGVEHAYAPGITLGARVTRGQHIGWVGDSGNAEETVPHLHFEIHTPDHIQINPYPSLLASAVAGTNVATVGALEHPDLGDFPLDQKYPQAVTVELMETAHGSMITLLQIRLRDLGFYTSQYLTGYFDDITKDAVIRLQRAHGLSITEKVDARTRAVLNMGTGFEEPLPPDAVEVKPDLENLKEGYRGPAVTQLQAKLKALGFFTSSTITDYFGPITKQALIQFQKAHGIDPTGVVGPETRIALDQQIASGALVFAGNLQKGSRGDSVRELQLKLKELDFYTSAYFTGEFDDLTQDAVIRFQRAKGIKQTGIVGPITRAALNPPISAVMKITPSLPVATAPVSLPPSKGSVVASTTPEFTEDLSEGSQGKAVTQLQVKLKMLGFFTATATGYFGPVTKAAVMSFQRARTINPTGFVGPKTRAVLNDRISGTRAQAPPAGFSGDQS